MRSVVSGQWGCSQRWRRRGAGDGWRGVAARRGGGPAGQRQVGDRPAGRQSRRAAISKRAPWLWTYAGRGWRAVASRRMRGRHAACVQVGRTPHAASIRGDDDCSPQPATPKENRSQVRLLSQAGTRAGAPQVAFGVTAPCRSSSRSARWEVAARTQGKAIAMHQQPSRASRGRENYLPMRHGTVEIFKAGIDLS